MHLCFLRLRLICPKCMIGLNGSFCLLSCVKWASAQGGLNGFVVVYHPSFLVLTLMGEKQGYVSH